MRLLKLAIFAGLSLAAMTACGSKNDAPVTQAAGSCSAGQVYSTQYGCLTQGSCQTGYGQSGSNCVSLTNSAQTYPAQNYPGNVTQGYPGYNQCPAGQVESQYNCIPQANCPMGQGFYNGGCIAITTPPQYPNSGYGPGCAPGTISVYQYGCLPQANCPYGYVLFENQCRQLVPMNNGYYYSGGVRFYAGVGFGFGFH